MRELEVNEKKKRLQLEEAETKKNELVQRLSFIASTKSKLEKELSETKQLSQASIDNLKQDITEHERRAQEYQLRIENQTKNLNEYEEAFLAIYGVGKLQCRNSLNIHTQMHNLTVSFRRRIQPLANIIENTVSTHFSYFETSYPTRNREQYPPETAESFNK